MKFLFIVSVLTSILLAEEITSIQFSGVEITNKGQEIYIKRYKHPKCENVNIISDNLFGGNLVPSSVPKECKKSVVVSLGSIQPIKIDNAIETVGELEVLRFLEKLEFEPDKYALIDGRESYWYEEMTIPNAINIPHFDIEDDEDIYNEYTRALKLLNIKKDKHGKLNFSSAKEVIVFCNANWCLQSVWTIKHLVKMGYPKNKIFWYRGGIQSWKISGFPTIKP